MSELFGEPRSTVARVRVGARTASVAAVDAQAIARAEALIAKTGEDPAAEEIRRRAGVFLRAAEAALAPPRIAFLFSGQGSQYPGMMRALAGDSAAARAIADRADRWAAAQGRSAISPMMFSGEAIPTELFAVQSTVLCADVMAFAALEEAGVRAAFVTGHSFGDYGALVAAGAWSLETALDATAIRCEAIAAASAGAEPAGMTSLAATAAEAAELVASASAFGHVELANTNAPDQRVIAGVVRALEVAERLAAARKIEATRLPIPRAFHSALMRGAQPIIAERFRSLAISEPRVPYLSSVTGAVVAEAEAIRASLAAQLTLPVDFPAQLGGLVRAGVNVFVECGPRGVLAGLARRIAPGAMVVTADDSQRPGRFAIARVSAAIDSVTPLAPASPSRSEVLARAPASPSRSEFPPRAFELSPAPEPVLARVGLAAPHLEEAGFSEFWREVQPGVARFVRELFERERAPVVASPIVSRSRRTPQVAEIMRRHVVRAIVAEPPAAKAVFAPRSLALLGPRTPRMEAIARAFAARGTSVVYGAEAHTEALGLVLDAQPAPPIWSLDQAAYRALRAETIDLLFRAARTFRGATIFAVTALGGALGFDNVVQGRPEGGAVLGLLKAIRREFPQLRVQALDASPLEDPPAVAAALLAELDAGSPRLEVGLLRNKRMVLAISERALPATLDEDAALPASWLITGGARGVTARIALYLAERYRPVLHLVGKHVLPPEAELAQLRALDAAGLEALKLALPRRSPLEWKAACEAIDKSLEIDKNLRAIAAHGSAVFYHAADTGDREAITAIVARARPIGGLIHGSGVEIAKAFDKKTDAVYEATIASKLDGAVNLLQAIEAAGEAPQAVIGFSSVSGRFGGHGQTDYSAANDGLARVLSAYRAKYPARKIFSFAWPAFSEVGLAARGSAKLFLERAGQSFMTPAEGAQHLMRELLFGGGRERGEAELVISDHPEHLDHDGACSDAKGGEGVIWSKDQVELVERTLEAKEAFLDQHRMAEVPILPAVVALEFLGRAAGAQAAVADFEIRAPLKVPPGGARVIRVSADGDRLAIAASTEKNDGVVLEPWRVYATARRAAIRAREDRPLELGEPRGVALEYPYGANPIFHGPMFRVVRSVTPHAHGGRAVLAAPLQPFATAIPIELLDGCLQAAGMLGRLLFGVVALPAGMKYFHRPERAVLPGQEINVEIVFTHAAAGELVSELVARDARGVVFAIEGYRASGSI